MQWLKIKLENIWRSSNKKTILKIWLTKVLIWSIFLSRVDSLSNKISDIYRIRSFEMWCWRRNLCITWNGHWTDEPVLLEQDLELTFGQEWYNWSNSILVIWWEEVGELALMVREGAMEGTRPRVTSTEQLWDNIREWRGKTYQECKMLIQDKKSLRKFFGGGHRHVNLSENHTFSSRWILYNIASMQYTHENSCHTFNIT